MYGDPKTTQGGHALKFYSDCRIEVSKTLAKEGDQAYGNITKVKTIKNKMAPPYKTTSFEIVYGKGIDRFAELMELGTDYEVLRKYGKHVTFKDTKFEYSEFEKLLGDNPELEEEIKNTIIKRIRNEESTPENDGL
jgi:recombination protein RecA